MVVYTAYEPINAPGDPMSRGEQLVFVKDGFLWLAALFPAIWLLVKGLWLELIVFLAAVAMLTWGLEAMGADPSVAGVLLVIVQMVLGFEAGNIYGAALERRGWRFAGAVTGRNQADCERRFFETWLTSQPQAPAAPAPEMHGPMPSWTGAARKSLKDAIARGRRLAGAKA